MGRRQTSLANVIAMAFEEQGLDHVYCDRIRTSVNLRSRVRGQIINELLEVRAVSTAEAQEAIGEVGALVDWDRLGSFIRFLIENLPKLIEILKPFLPGLPSALGAAGIVENEFGLHHIDTEGAVAGEGAVEVTEPELSKATPPKRRR